MKRLLVLTMIIVVFGATPAYAGKPLVGTPTPQPFTTSNCYLRCSSPALIRTTTPTFGAGISGTDGYFLRTTFEVRTGPTAKAPLVATSGALGPLFPPGVERWTINEGLLTPDTAYYWRARSRNELGAIGAWSAWQTFTIDRTPPGPTTIYSDEYPERQWAGSVGEPGTFHFSSNDLDVAEFHYHFNNSNFGVAQATGSGPRVASVEFNPGTGGSNIAYAEALDPAGNSSGTARYEFWVLTPPDVYLHWTLDGNTNDSGNLGAPGAEAGDVGFGSGRVGSGAAVFHGGNISTASSVVDTTKSFSMMAWANPADLSLGSQTVAAHGAARLYYDATAGNWCASLGTAVACATGAETGPPVNGQWVHVAMRFDASRGVLSVFVMGDFESCYLPSERADVNATGVASAGPLVAGEGFQGSIDELWVYRRALTSVEVCMAADI